MPHFPFIMCEEKEKFFPEFVNKWHDNFRFSIGNAYAIVNTHVITGTFLYSIISEDKHVFDVNGKLKYFKYNKYFLLKQKTEYYVIYHHYVTEPKGVKDEYTELANVIKINTIDKRQNCPKQLLKHINFPFIIVLIEEDLISQDLYDVLLEYSYTKKPKSKNKRKKYNVIENKYNYLAKKCKFELEVFWSSYVNHSPFFNKLSPDWYSYKTMYLHKFPDGKWYALNKKKKIMLPGDKNKKIVFYRLLRHLGHVKKMSRKVIYC